ncbi:terminase large subunit domain-containing protein [Paenibacillus sp. WLX2291]|uniref:terminase large subunit domain-containing protein n=1 Tax=Paenibacillus sp. WLX2291 TaxID=3296934 RepID=UPI003983F5AB
MTTTVSKSKKKSTFDIVYDDFKLFSKNFIKIVDNKGETVSFVLNKEQSEFIDSMGKFSQVLKSRQIGFSTLSLAYCLWNAVKFPNTSYMIVSLSAESVSSLFNKLKFANDNLPREKYKGKFPDTVRDNRNELVLTNGSRIQVASSEGKSGNVGRGGNFQFILLSEFAFYQNQQKVLTSIEQSLAKNENSKLVIETTANGMNFYYDLFMRAWKGNSNYKAYFYNWFADAYKEQFREDHDEAEKWYYAKHKYRLRENDLDEYEKNLYKNGCNLRFLMWRRWKLSGGMELSDFQQEYPSTPQESFKVSGYNVFNQGKILERLDYALPELSCSDLQCELSEMLLKFVGKKGLSIYHLPKRNMKYYAGVDTASGSNKDNSTIAIFDSEGIQVARFMSNQMSVYKFADFINEIGRFYNYALLCVERNSYGLPVIERLRETYQYMNMYKHKTYDKKGQRKLKLGFLTTDTTKVIMIQDMKEQFEKELIQINDKETLQEMIIFVENANGKMGNKSGNYHDDLVIATALCIQGMKSNKWYV